MREQMRKHPGWSLFAMSGLAALIVAIFGLAGFSINGQLESRKSAALRNCLSANETRRAIVDALRSIEYSSNARSDTRHFAFVQAYLKLQPLDCERYR